jgi:hypothetical protein
MPALPFTIALGRPSRGELLSLAGAVILIGSAVSWISTTAHVPPAVSEEPLAGVSLHINSSPSGATLTVDGQVRGKTPAHVSLAPGRHDITLSGADAIDETRSVEVEPNESSLRVNLWRARPSITYLKPPLPGAMLGDVVFLDDGRLALQVVLPDGERQAWTLDPDAHLASQRLGEAASRAPLAVRPDGRALAALQPRRQTDAVGSTALLDQVAAGEVWLVPLDTGVTPRHVWTAPTATAELVDLTWAPDARHLIVVGRQPVNGGAARTVIRWLDATTGEVLDLALLPSQVAPGTYMWSPDGQTVGFVARTASLAAVCTLSVAGEFRYLGDLGRDGLLGPPVAPVAWSADGHLLYGALVGQAPQAASYGSPFSQNPAGLYLADPAYAPGRAFSSSPSLAPLWRQDGRILALGLPTGQEGGLRLRDLDAHGNGRDVAMIDVPTPGPTAYGVRWDLAHGRAVVVTNRASNDGPTHDYWLVDFGWSTAQ